VEAAGAEFDASWSLDSEDSGFEKMESGFNARAIDFAKLGVLYLRRGNWRGRQLVPRSWVRTSTSPAPAASDYGYWWWLEPHGPFLARGNLGQFVFVDSRHEVVIVRFGTGDGGVDWPSVFAELADELPDPRPGARVRDEAIRRSFGFGATTNTGWERRENGAQRRNPREWRIGSATSAARRGSSSSWRSRSAEGSGRPPTASVWV